MFQLGLPPARRAAYEQALVSSRRMRITVTVMGRDETPLRDLAVPRVLAGAVQVDADADVSRSLALTLLDPAHKLAFDSANPAQGALYADNFVAVTYGVDTALGWVDVPVFWGPVTRFQREGAEVTIEGQGKESLGLDPHVVPGGYTIPKGRLVASAIRDVMDRTGERRYALTAVQGRLRHHRAVSPAEQPWKVLVGGSEDASGKPKPGVMTRATGHPLLFYDGAGRLTAKRRGGPAVFQLTGQHVTQLPGYAYDVLSARNRVTVKGGKPKHGRGNFRGVAVLPAAHPLSAQNLARNGRPRYMTEQADADNLRSDRACRQHAQAILDGLANQGIEADLECLPVPHLEESDPVSLTVDGYSFTFPLRRFTIPLTHDAGMSIGVATAARFRRRRGRPRR